MKANQAKNVPFVLDRFEKFLIGFVVGYAAMTIFAAGYLAGLLSSGPNIGLSDLPIIFFF